MNLKFHLPLLFAFLLSYPCFSQDSSVDSLFFEAGNYRPHSDTLIDVFSQVLQLDPYNFEAYYERGSVYYHIWLKSEKKDDAAYQKAMEDFNNAILLNEQYPPPFFLRSVLYFHENELEQAFSDISRAIRLDNFNHKYYARRGFMYKKIEDYSLAEANFEMAIELIGMRYYNPDKWEILTDLYRDRAFCQAKQRRYRRALRSVNKAINFGGIDNLKSFLYKGNIYAEMGKYKKALRMYNYIAGRDQGFYPVYLYRGKVYYALDQKEKAFADWERITKGELDIDFKKVSVRPGF